MAPLILYYDDISPPARSCLMLIKMLNIPVELKRIDLFKSEHLTEEFLQINPIHTVPTLVHKNLTLTDSHAILMYLAERFETDAGPFGNGERLLPTDKMDRIKILNRLFFECSVLFRRDSEMMSEIVRKGFSNIDFPYYMRKITEVYDIMEKYLNETKYMAIDHLTLADLSIVTTLSTVDILVQVTPEHWPKLLEWFKKIKDLTAYEVNKNGLANLKGVLQNVGRFQIAPRREY